MNKEQDLMRKCHQVFLYKKSQINRKNSEK